jgi:hypothetical protein
VTIPMNSHMTHTFRGRTRRPLPVFTGGIQSASW